MIELDLTGITNGQRAMVDACPMVCVTPRTIHVPLDKPGKRWVMAGDGLYMEARSLSLHVMVRVSDHDSAFGKAVPFHRTINGRVPQDLLDECARLAVQGGVKETAALIHWNPEEGRYELTVPEMISAGPVHVSYRDESKDELLVIDFHSHGHLPGYFSSTDDDSDNSRVGPYIAMVAGNCQSVETLNVCSRICLAPYLVQLEEMEQSASK